jgi:hypothetical protein
MNQDNYLASVAAQLGVKAADRSAYDGILVGSIKMDATIANGIHAQGAVETVAENGTAAMLRLNNAQPWRGIITGVEAVVTGDSAIVPTAGTFADSDLFFQHAEAIMVGSGGTYRCSALQCGSIRPTAIDGAAAVASTYCRNGTQNLAAPYWYDAVGTVGFRWLSTCTTAANVNVSLILHGIFASANQSKGDTNKSVPGIVADPANICGGNRLFDMAIGKQILSQNRVTLGIESALQAGS